jgi:hypothetical protein
MRKLLLTGTAILLLTASLVLVASAAARPTAAAGATKLIVAMRDPGCHWFYLGGGPNQRKYTKTVVRQGPVQLVNLDEATLIIKGPGAPDTTRSAQPSRSRRRASTRSPWSSRHPTTTT